MAGRKLRFSIDVGGTFTDIVVLDEESGDIRMDKVATTPDDTLRGVLAAIDKAAIDLADVPRFFVHGSTTALNALLERKGVPMAFVTTLGFRDVPEIMRYNRPEMYNPHYRKPPQIVERRFRHEVCERLDARGRVITPLDEHDARAVARRIGAQGVASVAVCFLHAFRNPAHERRMGEILREELPGVAIILSSDVTSEHREFERGMTTILTGYLAPVVNNWIDALERALAERGFAGRLILTRSDGGGMTSDTARARPINMLLSGPAGGVIGGVHLARACDTPNLITMDVGGTSFDVAIIRDGDGTTRTETTVNGYPMLLSNLDIRTIGAGGGSIARIDAGGALIVGPESAGAVPGPVAYGRGGSEPTVTDAFIMSGLVSSAGFLGGDMKLDVAGARSAIDARIAQPLGLSTEAAASGILRLAMNSMADAVREITSETGQDPRDYAMLCFGGGGALFGAFIADELALKSAIVPPMASVYSARGMLTINLRHDLEQTIAARLDDLDDATMNRVFASLRESGACLLEAQGVPPERHRHSLIADMRYQGQEHSVAVDLTDVAFADTMQAFADSYHRVYGYTLDGKAEVVTLRVRAIGEIDAPRIAELAVGGADAGDAQIGTREAIDFLDNAQYLFRLYERTRLKAENRIAGPAIIEEATTSTIVRAGQQCVVDRHGNLVITRIAA